MEKERQKFKRRRQVNTNTITYSVHLYMYLILCIQEDYHAPRFIPEKLTPVVSYLYYKYYNDMLVLSCTVILQVYYYTTLHQPIGSTPTPAFDARRDAYQMRRASTLTSNQEAAQSIKSLLRRSKVWACVCRYGHKLEKWILVCKLNIPVLVQNGMLYSVCTYLHCLLILVELCLHALGTTLGMGMCPTTTGMRTLLSQSFQDSGSTTSSGASTPSQEDQEDRVKDKRSWKTEKEDIKIERMKRKRKADDERRGDDTESDTEDEIR